MPSPPLHRRRPALLSLAPALLALALTGACTGVIDAGGSSSGENGPGPTRASTDDPTLCGAEIDPGPRIPLRRLTRDEYDNSVRELVGDDTRPAQAFPADEDAGGFDLGATVSPLQLELYMFAAEGIAKRVVAERLEAVLPCDPSAIGEDACALELIEHLGPRAYRRPLTDNQRDRLLAVYDFGKTEGFDNGVRLVISAMLQSPAFLYRVEVGAELSAGEPVVALDSYERASKLSYLLWSSMPDEELFAVAAAGGLDTNAGVTSQARRMLHDPRARASVRRFLTQWLHLDLDAMVKDPERYPAFDEDLRASMKASLEAFLDYVVWERNGDLRELLTADYTFVDEGLAAIYGIEGISGDELQRVTLDRGERSGILTHPGVLASLALPTQSSPVERGAFVRQQLFCQTLPPPPEGLLVVPPDPDPTLSTRERFIQHRQDPACSGCHQLMDPIGFGFENYDAIGAYRLAEEDGQRVDARGDLVDTDTDGPFEGAIELTDRLAESEMVRRCATQQWFRFAFGRAETTSDQCVLDDAMVEFEASGWDLREVLITLTTSDAFLYRRGEEVGP